jgi:hypothetical protein
MSAIDAKLVTAAELFAMGDIGRCELIYGELVMMSPANFDHGVIASRLDFLLRMFVMEHDLGEVLVSEAGFKVEMSALSRNLSFTSEAPKGISAAFQISPSRSIPHPTRSARSPRKLTCGSLTAQHPAGLSILQP